MKILLMMIAVISSLYSKDIVNSVKIEDVKIEGVKNVKVKKYMTSLIKYKKGEYIDPFNINLIEIELEKNPSILSAKGKVEDGVLTFNIKTKEEISSLSISYEEDLFVGIESYLNKLKTKDIDKKTQEEKDKVEEQIKKVNSEIEHLKNKYIQINDILEKNKDTLSKKNVESISNSLLVDFRKYTLNEDVILSKKVKEGVLNLHFYDSKKLKIKKVVINHHLKDELKENIESIELVNKEYSIFNEIYFADMGYYQKSKVKRDLEDIQDYLLKNGYINPKISVKSKINFIKEEVDIYVLVEEGDRYVFNEIRLVGNSLKDKEMEKKITSKFSNYIKENQNQNLNKISVIDLIKEIEKDFENNGYKYPLINLNEKKLQGNKVDFEIEINERDKYFIDKIKVEGILKTEEQVVLKQLRIKEGEEFSNYKIDKSKINLQRLGFFKEVQMIEEEENAYSKTLNLKVKVEEDKTGIITGSLGYNDVDKILYGISIEERNFLGKGYAIGLSSQHSSTKTDFSFNFTNPYLTETIGSTTKVTYKEEDYDLFYSKDKYLEETIFKRLTDEETVGGGVLLGTKETVNKSLIPNVETEEEKVGFQVFLSHNSTDNYNFPENGIKASANIKNFGIMGGDIKYSRLSLGYNNYLTYGEEYSKKYTLKTSLSGFITKDEGYIPISEKLYMGGSDLRGFKSYSIYPENSLVGGNTKFTGSFEVVTDTELIPRTKVGLFYDYGVVADNLALKDKAFRNSIGLGFYWISPIGPLSISFAQPLNGEVVEQSIFEFKLGSSF